MPLTPAQQATLKTNILANTSTIPAGQPWTGAFAGVQVKDVPNSGDGNVAVAGYYNQTASPNYFVWRTTISRSEVYFTLSPDGTVFDFAAYKSQSVPEQNTWTQMFMGDNAPFSALNFRAGVFSVFSGSAPQNAQRAHIFAVGRKLARRIEQLFAVAPTSAGGITVGPNNGNTVADALGGTTNPAILVVDGTVSASDVNSALNLP